MPERRNEEIERIAQAERQAAVLSASIAQLRSAIEHLAQVREQVGDASQDMGHIVMLAERLQREFRNLTTDNLPQVQALIQEISRELSAASLEGLVSDISQAEEVLGRLLEKVDLLRRVEVQLGIGGGEETLVGILSQYLQPQRGGQPPTTGQPDWNSIRLWLMKLGALDKLEDIKQAFERNDIPQLTRILRQISSSVLDMKDQIPSELRNLLGEHVIRQYLQAVREGNVASAERVLYVMRERLGNIGRSINQITTGLENINQNAESLPQLARVVRQTGMTIGQLADRYLSRLMSEMGLGGLYASMREMVRLFRSVSGKVFAIAAVVEIAMAIYRLFQQTYMEGRRFIQMTQMPGAGILNAFTQAGLTQSQITRMVRSIALEFQNFMDRAYRDLRIPQQEYVQVLQQLKQSSLLVEASFRGLSIATLLQQGRFEEGMRITDELVRKFYSLSYATGLSYNTLMNGARQMMRLMGTHDLERALDTFVAINEIGTRFGISGSLMLEWIASATQELRWFGYALNSNVNILTRYSDALYKGMVQIQDFTRAVETFTGRNQQVEAIGFVTAIMQPQGALGEFLRETIQQSGLLEAFSLFRTLTTSSIELLREAAQRQNIAGEVARELLQRQDIGRLIQEARRIQLEGTEQIARQVGGGPFATLEVFRQITQMPENIAKMADSLDAVKRYFAEDRPLDRVYDGLKPLTDLTRLVTTTEEMLGASKNLSQHLVSIKTMLRSLVQKIVFGGTPGLTFPHITRPGSR